MRTTVNSLTLLGVALALLAGGDLGVGNRREHLPSPAGIVTAPTSIPRRRLRSSSRQAVQVTHTS